MQECSHDVCRDKEWSGGLVLVRRTCSHLQRGQAQGPLPFSTPLLVPTIPTRTSTRPPPFLHAAPCPYNPYGLHFFIFAFDGVVLGACLIGWTLFGTRRSTVTGSTG